VVYLGDAQPFEHRFPWEQAIGIDHNAIVAVNEQILAGVGIQGPVPTKAGRTANVVLLDIRAITVAAAVAVVPGPRVAICGMSRYESLSWSKT
jgi:hypothetical protein